MKDAAKPAHYETNPFKLAWQGVKKLSRKSPVTFWLLFVLSFISAASNLIDQRAKGEAGQATPTMADPSVGEALFILGLVLFIVFVLFSLAIVVWGIIGYSASQLAKNQDFTLKEAFEASLNNFERLFLVALVMLLRILGWSLLFIIPGFIMAVRYSLSAVVAFAEPDLQPGQVVSRSAQLTKGAWFDTFATRYLLSILTLTTIDMAVDAAAQSQMYRQLSELKESGAKKPKTHPLSYLALLLPFILAGAYVAIVGPEAAAEYMLGDIK